MLNTAVSSKMLASMAKKEGFIYEVVHSCKCSDNVIRRHSLGLNG